MQKVSNQQYITIAHDIRRLAGLMTILTTWKGIDPAAREGSAQYKEYSTKVHGLLQRIPGELKRNGIATQAIEYRRRLERKH